MDLSVVGGRRAYVIVLNWNGWSDTIECLESLLRSDYPDFRVVVCDNASRDGSLERICEWLEGELEAVAQNPSLRYLVDPAVEKPIAYASVNHSSPEAPPDVPVILVGTGANRGFAGGNNVGIRLALRDPDCGFVWLLNNDTVVARDALTHLVHRVVIDGAGDCCGSRLVFYDHPELIQALGGATYRRLTGQMAQIGSGQSVTQSVDVREVESKMAYVAGASMLLTRRFLETIGLLSEDYFLYYEEIDLAARAKGKARLAYADSSVVFHKEGRSIGTSTLGTRSELSAFLLYYNKIKFVKKFHRAFLLPTLLFIWRDALKAVLRRDWRLAYIIFSASLERDVIGVRKGAAS
jgi:GT2 family glycosyltransferase